MAVKAEHVDARDRGPWLPGLLLGAGLGGFVDGIVFHQLLQWHHLLSARSAPVTVESLEHNTLADGLFHVATWVAVVLGLWLLWRRQGDSWRQADSGRALGGWILVGWGAFNLVEGIVNHHLLGLHHVRDDVAEPLPWDLAFLASGALLVIGGLLLALRSRPGAGDAGKPPPG